MLVGYAAGTAVAFVVFVLGSRAVLKTEHDAIRRRPLVVGALVIGMTLFWPVFIVAMALRCLGRLAGARG